MISLSGEVTLVHKESLVTLQATPEKILISLSDWKVFERGYKLSSFFANPSELFKKQISQPVEVHVEGKRAFRLVKGRPVNFSFKAVWHVLLIWFKGLF